MIFMNWHTRHEKEAIRKYHGTPQQKYGYDGTIRGRPVEVRETRKDDRYRIQEDVHRELVRHGGSYIFVNGRETKRVPAREVSDKIGRGPWYKDRTYPHKFLKKDQVF